MLLSIISDLFIDSKTLVVLAANAVATFWRWTDEEPYLLGEMDMESMHKRPSITSRNNTFLITFTDRLVYLATEIKR